MAFVYERIPETDRELFDSFEIFDHTDGRRGVIKWYDGREWVADRKNEIYFTFVGRDWDEDRTPQYDLIWKGKKIAIKYNCWYKSDHLGSDSTHYRVCCTHMRIQAPKEFRQYEEEMIELIKSVIAFDCNHEFSGGKFREHKYIAEFEKIATPEYFDEVE